MGRFVELHEGVEAAEAVRRIKELLGLDRGESRIYGSGSSLSVHCVGDEAGWGWSVRSEWRVTGFSGTTTTERFDTDAQPLSPCASLHSMIPDFSTIRRPGSGIDHQDGRHLRGLGRVDVQGRQGGSVLDGGDGACESWRSTFPPYV
jgi:hypothetical protein